MNEIAKWVWDLIDKNRDMSRTVLAHHIVKKTGVAAVIAEAAVIRWAVGDQAWFNQNFN